MLHTSLLPNERVLVESPGGRRLWIHFQPDRSRPGCVRIYFDGSRDDFRVVRECLLRDPENGCGPADGGC